MTRRRNGEGSIYKRKDGRWTGATYVLNADGGRQRRQVYGNSPTDVAAKIAELRVRTAHGLPSAANRSTVRTFGDVWLAQLPTLGLKPATVSNYRWTLERYVYPEVGSVRLTALTPQHVRQVMTAVTRRGASARTAQLTRAVLRSMLADAEREQVVHRNVATLVRGPRVERVEVVPWSAQEAAKFLASMREHRLYALVAVGISLGLRKGELLALRWDNVDLEGGTLRVVETVQRLGKGVGLVVGTPKTARSRRTVPLPEVCRRALLEHRELQDKEREAAGTTWTEHGLVFTTRTGTVLEPRNVNRLLDERIAAAGVRRIRFHDMRHTCASLLLSQGVQPRVVMEVLGHSQMAITTDLYGHVMPPATRAAAAAMDDVLGG